MPIPVRTNRATRIRQLRQQQPYLTEQDIVALTGYRLPEVKAALKRVCKDRPKSRAGW